MMANVAEFLGISAVSVVIWMIVIVVVIALIIMMISVYNGLVRKRNQCQNSFAQVDTALMRRFDLIPNLVEVAKKYMEHERETLEAVISARNQAKGNLDAAKSDLGNAALMNTASKSEGVLNSALGRLMAVVESYPDLKANEQMQSLHQELATTENLIAAHRQTYNIDATEYNNYLQVFPNNMIGGMFSFKPGALYEISDIQREAPKVTF
ncbi:LemA family protein [Wohlfahrtiimonas larvae]|uniref:LemA family protein n=1 Tax=Wohlfahrtiimonas larvae TaxID=1157986 RepID=A0ABP9MU87_9GAMM|nr:LemA family protein [Wohlfahrtiimonas larvae]